MRPLLNPDDGDASCPDGTCSNVPIIEYDPEEHGELMCRGGSCFAKPQAQEFQLDLLTLGAQAALLKDYFSGKIPLDDARSFLREMGADEAWITNNMRRMDVNKDKFVNKGEFLAMSDDGIDGKKGPPPEPLEAQRNKFGDLTESAKAEARAAHEEAMREWEEGPAPALEKGEVHADGTLSLAELEIVFLSQDVPFDLVAARFSDMVDPNDLRQAMAKFDEDTDNHVDKSEWFKMTRATTWSGMGQDNGPRDVPVEEIEGEEGEGEEEEDDGRYVVIDSRSFAAKGGKKDDDEDDEDEDEEADFITEPGMDFSGGLEPEAQPGAGAGAAGPAPEEEPEGDGEAQFEFDNL
eukprot:tig00000402_g250.t1